MYETDNSINCLIFSCRHNNFGVNKVKTDTEDLINVWQDLKGLRKETNQDKSKVSGSTW